MFSSFTGFEYLVVMGLDEPISNLDIVYSNQSMGVLQYG